MTKNSSEPEKARKLAKAFDARKLIRELGSTPELENVRKLNKTGEGQ